jgi:hypothetical protein
MVRENKDEIDRLRRAAGDGLPGARKTTFITTLQALYVAAQVDANTSCDTIGELRRPRWKAIEALLACINAFAKLPQDEIELRR